MLITEALNGLKVWSWAESLKLPRMFCLFGWRSVYATHWIFPFAINLPIGFMLCARIVLLPFWGRHRYYFFYLWILTAEKPLFPGNFEPFIAAVLIDLYSLSEWLYFEGKSHFCLPQLWTESLFLPRLQNQLFRLLELPKPFVWPPLSGFRVTW